MRVYLGFDIGVRFCGLGDREIMFCCMSLLIVEKRIGIYDYIVLNKRKIYYIKMKLKMLKYFFYVCYFKIYYFDVEKGLMKEVFMN